MQFVLLLSQHQISGDIFQSVLQWENQLVLLLSQTQQQHKIRYSIADDIFLDVLQ